MLYHEVRDNSPYGYEIIDTRTGEVVESHSDESYDYDSSGGSDGHSTH